MILSQSLQKEPACRPLVSVPGGGLETSEWLKGSFRGQAPL